MSLFVGVDGGGSRTTAVAVDEHGAEVARGGSGPCGFQSDGPVPAAAAIGALLAELTRPLPDQPVVMLVCAMAGGGRPGPAKELERLLGHAGLADDVAVVTDADAALHAAFGTGPGILVIAGTGSIAVGRRADGRIGRSGGLLPPGGDPGSGEWLARQAILAGVDRVFSREQWALTAPRAEVSAVARAVCEAADSGDRTARQLLERAAGELAALALDVEASLAPWSHPPKVALAGGLLEPGRPVRAALTATLGRVAPHLSIVVDRVDGALGAALLALGDGSVAPDES